MLTGPGTSVESGISPRQGPNSPWSRFNPSEVASQTPLSDSEIRRLLLQRVVEDNKQLLKAQPNAAHLAISELGKLGLLDCLITQNADDLHRRAGSSPEKTLELHGNATYLKCQDCARRYDLEQIVTLIRRADREVPGCESCGGVLKSATLARGDQLPEWEMRESAERSRYADVFLVVGTSLRVYPAAFLPRIAVEGGAKLIIVNLNGSTMDNRADVVLKGNAGEIMPLVVKRVKERLKEGGM
ncbi:MAG: Sir2 family NAD-dependent protein deacetylase [Dehalococcoidia bacterium]|nr:Sir2 family NAD-dependent protein deacetylase [Dehalococcoidia bacterium]